MESHQKKRGSFSAGTRNRPSESAGEKLRLLKERYIRGLSEYRDRIEALVERLKGDETEGEDARMLCGILHTLAGSAPSFGFTALGEAARRAETLVSPVLEAKGGFSEDHREKMAASLRELSLAFAEAKEDKGTSLSSEETSTECCSPRKNDKLIFLVEDDENLLRNLAVQIECFGYQVRSFPGVAHVREEVARTLPSAIIMDLVFPEGGVAGAELVAHIQREVDRHIPVIFISRRDDFTARLESVRAGGDAYLTKPLDIIRLIEKLDQLTECRTADPYRILIIDDDPDLSRFYAFTLERHGMRTRVVNNPLQVIEHLVEFNPELILMDMYMEGCRGDELAHVIRQMEAYVSIPIVYLSAETRKDRQLSAMSMGADDFLTKPIKPEHLISSVTIRAERMRIIRSFMEQDSLTGLLNHTKTKEQLDLAVLRSTRGGGVFSFAMVDIDGFKSINDRYGHLIGDRVILVLSRLLQQRLRRTDIIGRYGGEEFAAILMDTTSQQAFHVMDEIRRTFAQILHESEQGEFHVTFSCGIASFPDFYDSLTLCREADRALYEVKDSGRNRVVLRVP